jgi:SPFH domain / Band 7 family
MAHIRRYPFLRHLLAQPNQYILHFTKGKLTRQGAGIAYWFRPLSAAAAQVPVEDIETTFAFKELSQDFQEITVQCSLRYRCADPVKAAARVNFAIALDRGIWLEEPLERLASLWSQRAQQPARAYILGAPVIEAVRSGARVIQAAMEEALRSDPEIEAGGLALVSLLVNRVAPSADVEKALQTPTREAIQQKADEATFLRRAMAVEKERAIKENELNTEIELAKRQEELIRQHGANRLEEIRREAEAEEAKVTAESARRLVTAQGAAEESRLRTDAEASARRLLGQIDGENEALRVAAWKDLPSPVVFGLALRELGGKIQTIEHLNLTPDLLSDVVKKWLRQASDT